MNKRLLKPILTSGLLALAFGAIGTGATFALFTSEAETDIVIGAGKVAVSFTPSGLKTYSVEAKAGGDRIDERGGEYISKETAVNGKFTNGGTAAYADGVFTLDKITPGDRITFDVTLANQSTVNIKYRLVYAFVGNDLTDTTLARGLVTTTDLSGAEDPVTYKGLKTFRSEWIELAANAAPEQTDYSFDIELPVDKGNEFQQKSARFTMYAEAVQGNADVADEPLLELFEEEFHNDEPVPVVAGQPTIVEAENESGTIGVKTTIPADTTGVPAGRNVDLVVSEMVVGEDPLSSKTTLNFDISLYINNVKTTSFESDVTVEINVGKHLSITEVKHNGNVITSYTYNVNEGIIRFTTRNFSPFSVTYVTEPYTPTKTFGFADSYVIGDHYVHEVTDRDEFRNIMAHIVKYTNADDAQTANSIGTDDHGIRYADEKTVYLVTEDIDFRVQNNVAPVWAVDANEPVFQRYFFGTLQGEGQRTLSKMSSTANYGGIAKGKSGDNIIVGLFDRAYNCTFKNLTLHEMSLNNSVGQYSGLFASGSATDNNTVTHAASICFENCIVDETCSVNIEEAGSAFIAGARYIKAISFKNCTNKANITTATSAHTAGAFLCNAIGGPSGSTLVFEGCKNYGTIRATKQVGAFAGYADNGNRDVTIKNCENYGDVYASAGIPGGAGLFIGQQTVDTRPWFHSLAMDGENIYAASLYTNIASETATDAELKQLTTGWNNTEFRIDDIFSVKDGNGVPRSGIEGYRYFVKKNNTFAVNFNASNDYKLETSASVAGMARLKVDIGVHTLRIDGTTGYEYRGETGGENIKTYNIFDGAATDLTDLRVKRIGQCGFFVPSSAEDPKSSYADCVPGANKDTPISHFRIDDACHGVSGYEDGYHARENGASYVVITNDVMLDGIYNAISVWRSQIHYYVTAYDADGKILATGTTSYGYDYAHSGYGAVLTPIAM